MRFGKFYTFFLLLLFLVVVEGLCLNKWLDTYDRRTISILYLLCGLAVAVIAAIKVERPKWSSPRKWPWLVSVLLFLGLVMLIIPTAKKVMAGVPVDYKISDVLPIMQEMSERFITGKEVYAVIPEIWGVTPIYLPAMWLPYTSSVVFHFDPRWVTMTFMLAAAGLLLALKPKTSRPAWLSLSGFLPLLVIFLSILVWDTRFVSMSDEGVVVGYYTFLFWALWNRNPWVIGVALALATLARVSLLPWIPVYGLFVFFFESRRRAYQIAGTALGLGLLLMTVTTAIFHLDIFAALPGRYLEAVMGPNYKALRETIDQSLGLAKFCTQEQLPVLQRITFLFTFGLPALALLAFWRFRSAFDPAFFPLITLKLTLVMFFNLLIIPVNMLFFSSALLSVAIFIFYTHQREMPEAIA